MGALLSISLSFLGISEHGGLVGHLIVILSISEHGALLSVSLSFLSISEHGALVEHF